MIEELIRRLRALEASVEQLQRVEVPAAHLKRTTTATNYTVLSSDELVAVTSTASARTISLPAASTLPVGFALIVTDESGAAASHNITVQRAGADTVDGATTKVISTNYGVARLYVATSTTWQSW